MTYDQKPIKEFISTIKNEVESDKLETIDTKISSFTTDYTFSDYSSSTNIELATKSINNKILMPGQTFNFSTIVGNSTTDIRYNTKQKCNI